MILKIYAVAITMCCIAYAGLYYTLKKYAYSMLAALEDIKDEL